MRHSASSDPLEIELHQGLEFIKRKQESKKKERKHALDQESDKKKTITVKKKKKENSLSTKKPTRKTILVAFLVESVFSFFLIFS